MQFLLCFITHITFSFFSLKAIGHKTKMFLVYATFNIKKEKKSNKNINIYDSSNRLGYRTLIVLSCGQDTYSAFDVAHVNFDSLNAS